MNVAEFNTELTKLISRAYDEGLKKGKMDYYQLAGCVGSHLAELNRIQQDAVRIMQQQKAQQENPAIMLPGMRRLPPPPPNGRSGIEAIPLMILVAFVTCLVWWFSKAHADQSSSKREMLDQIYAATNKTGGAVEGWITNGGIFITNRTWSRVREAVQELEDKQTEDNKKLAQRLKEIRQDQEQQMVVMPYSDVVLTNRTVNVDWEILKTMRNELGLPIELGLRNDGIVVWRKTK